LNEDTIIAKLEAMLTITEHEGVTRIKMSRFPESHPPYCVCAYLVDGLLIDSGPGATAAELVDFLKDKGVRVVVNTHYHHDHIGGNAALQEKYGVELLAHPLAIGKLKHPPRLYPYQEAIWGETLPSEAKEIGEVVKTPSFQFEVIPTPGHSEDHISLFERSKRWLFGGDLATTTHPRLARAEEDQWKTIASLEKIAALAPRVLFTSPENIITTPAAFLPQLIRYLKKTGEKITALSLGGLSPAEIASRLFGEDAIAGITGGQFSSENFVKSYLKKH